MGIYFISDWVFKRVSEYVKYFLHKGLSVKDFKTVFVFLREACSFCGFLEIMLLFRRGLLTNTGWFTIMFL